MANVIRLVNGGTIQVRTGVMQGMGPIGPKGPAGPQGIDGPAGPVGEQGPIGQIMQKQGRAQVATTNAVAVNTDTLIGFGSVAYDDLSCFTSTTNITLLQAGDYQLSCWLRFDDAPSTAREIWFMVGSTMIARSSRMAGTGAVFYMDLVYPYRAAAGEIVNVYAKAGSATAISAGNMVVTRTGSGPVGPSGPTGPPGPTGAQGPQGIQGNPGNANSGFVKYGDMLPH